MKKQSDGFYRTKVRVGFDAEGKPIDKWIRSTTQRGLQEEKERIRRYYIDGAVNVDRTQTFGTFAMEWYRTRKEPFISETSKYRYRAVFNRHLFPYLGDRRLTAIRRADLQDVLNKVSGMSKSFIKSVKGAMYSVFAEAVQQRIIEFNPAQGLLDPDHTEPTSKRALTKEERALLEPHLPEYPWLAILYYTGMRGGELRALRWRDIDLRANEIHITRALGIRADDVTPGKTSAAKRTVPIVPQLARILQSCRSLPDTPVTDGHYLAIHQFITLFSNTMRACGLPADLSAHCMRHNFITLCWERRIDVVTVSRIVGHSHPSITMDIYTHLDNVSSRDTRDEITAAFL